jgi:hypothetical protein
MPSSSGAVLRSFCTGAVDVAQVVSSDVRTFPSTYTKTTTRKNHHQRHPKMMTVTTHTHHPLRIPTVRVGTGALLTTWLLPESDTSSRKRRRRREGGKGGSESVRGGRTGRTPCTPCAFGRARRRQQPRCRDLGIPLPCPRM